MAINARVTLTYNKFPQIAARLPGATSRIVRKSALDIEARAKAVVPVDTGNLKGSITTEAEAGATTAVVYTAVEYAMFVEFGTVKMAAQPYMTPAAEQVRPSFIAAMSQLEKHIA